MWQENVDFRMAHAVPSDAVAFPAPAKLNLMLHITGQRSDGYHLLETVFRYIGLYDSIYLRKRADEQIVLHTLIEGVAAEQDLTYKAAKVLQDCLSEGQKQGVDIWVEKKIPMGGGLGGGSSDAATVLLVLNQWWDLCFSTEKLIQLAVGLGADVPFFVYGQNSFASGIGEVLTPVSLNNQWYVVIKPQVHVATAKIFSHKLLTRDSKPCIMRALQTKQPQRNDMQAVVCDEYPAVKAALDELAKYGNSLMTGSGACIFLGFDVEYDAQQVYETVLKSFEAYLVKGLDSQPVLEMI